LSTFDWRIRSIADERWAYITEAHGKRIELRAEAIGFNVRRQHFLGKTLSMFIENPERLAVSA